MQMKMNTSTLLLVDDQSMMLDGIESLLATMDEVKVLGRCTNGKDAVAQAELLRPDLVLMDVNMPGMDGIEATKRLLKVSPYSKVLILSMYGHKEFVLEVMEAGACGYLLKNAGKLELMEALHIVATGGKYVARELAAVIANGDRFKDRRGETRYGALSKREVDIVRLILQERTSQEIAETLFLSSETVETHRRNIMHKLDVRNTAGLVKYAMERGWGNNNESTNR
ncbi:MAG: response regulator transcription factor [Flavobacteriales bacterium]|nr:response regulator transcription factor [Flavobacteriales bacterium]